MRPVASECLGYAEGQPLFRAGRAFLIMKTEGIIMGVGAPNESKNNGKSMCAIILTRDHGFIRIYPLPAEERFPVWGTVRIEAKKGSDVRDSTWKIVSWEVTGKIESPQQKAEILDACQLKSGMADPCDFMNQQRKSIFLVRLQWGSIEATLSQKIPSYVSSDDEECGWIVTQAKHWLKPYITWTSLQGKSHTSHLGGREIYEGIRHNPTEPWNLMNNLQIMNPDYEKWMLMGNTQKHKNVWLCVHLHRLKKQMCGSTPLFSNPIIGESEGWPYSKQEAANVPIVDGHPELFTMSDMISASTRGNMIPAI